MLYCIHNSRINPLNLKQNIFQLKFKNLTNFNFNQDQITMTVFITGFDQFCFISIYKEMKTEDGSSFSGQTFRKPD